MWRSVRPARSVASASAADLDDLFSRKLLFVTGKGGTGKTSVAAAIARAAAARGMRTLACEMDAKGDLATSLGVSVAGFEPVAAAENVHVMTMDTEPALREYLRVHMRLPLAARLGPLASTLDFVADAAPGVKEVLAVGKVCWEVREGKWDLVVVDGEASGHIVSQISSPRVIRSLVPRGPLADQTSWMLDILDDAARTGIVVTSRPEDMVVTETIELVRRVRAETATDVALIVVNGCPGCPVDPADLATFESMRSACADFSVVCDPGVVAALEAAAGLVSRWQDGREQVARLADALAPVPIREVPLVAVDEVDDALRVVFEDAQ